MSFTSCSSSVSSSKVEQRIIFPHYHVLYDANSNSLMATVTFQTDNESGEYVKLSKSSKISFNQTSMQLKSDKERPSYYFFEQKGVESFPDAAVFEYSNDDEESFINKLHVKSVVISDITLQKSGTNTIKYAGKPLNDDEELMLVLGKDGERIEIQAEPVDGKMLLIDAASLRSVKPGKYEGYLVRTFYTTFVNAMDRGGVAETVYHSEIHTIIVK